MIEVGVLDMVVGVARTVTGEREPVLVSEGQHETMPPIARPGRPRVPFH